MSEREIRLTAYSACAGCAAKMGPNDLRQALAALNPSGSSAHANLLVGLEQPDDAAVYAMGGEVLFTLAVAGIPREMTRWPGGARLFRPI